MYEFAHSTKNQFCEESNKWQMLQNLNNTHDRCGEISLHDNFSQRIYPWDPWQISGMHRLHAQASPLWLAGSTPVKNLHHSPTEITQVLHSIAWVIKWRHLHWFQIWPPDWVLEALWAYSLCPSCPSTTSQATHTFQKAAFRGFQNLQIILNFLQKDCRRTQKLSVLVPDNYQLWNVW